MGSGVQLFDDLGPRDSFGFRVANINEFRLRLSYPPIADWNNAKFRVALLDRLTEDVLNLLQTAEFFSQEQVTLTQSDEYLAVNYKDDVYDFEIACSHDRIIIRKAGTEMKNFHHWYHAAMPTIKEVVASLLSIMNSELRRAQRITYSNYSFNFIVYSFKERGLLVKNFQVLRELVTQIPSTSGAISGIATEISELSRLDYRVNRWHENADRIRRRVTYSVEAPSNKQYSGLWFNFAYGSETYTDPETGRRTWTDPQNLLDEYGDAYDFLWNQGLNGFMRSVISHLSFDTTPTYIP